MKAQLTQESKDEIIKALKEELEYNGEQFPNNEDGIKRAIFCIESFKTSDEGRWIPVSERLPEEGERVIVYGRKSQSSFGIQSATFHDWLNKNAFYDDEDFELIVTHWQPLPKSP